MESFQNSNPIGKKPLGNFQNPMGKLHGRSPKFKSIWRGATRQSRFVASELSLSECSRLVVLNNSFWPKEWPIHGDFYGLTKCSQVCSFGAITLRVFVTCSFG